MVGGGSRKQLFKAILEFEDSLGSIRTPFQIKKTSIPPEFKGGSRADDHKRTKRQGMGSVPRLTLE